MRIVISGTVGVGKSTVTQELFKELKKTKDNIEIYEELQGDNPYLEKYYANRPAWSFLIQMDFLMSRYYNTIKEEERQARDPNRIVIFDRHFLDDYIFANLDVIKEDMSALNLNVYMKTNLELASRLSDAQKPDYFFLLKAPFEDIIERIKTRGRDEEQEVDLNYWKDMYNAYYEKQEVKDYINKHAKKVIEINASNSIKNIIEEIMVYLYK